MTWGGTARLGGALVLLLICFVGSMSPTGASAQSSRVTDPDASGPEAAAASGARARFVVRSTTDALTVDGVLDEAAWRSAVTIALPFEVAPADNAPAPVSTECRITYDDEHLYLGCVADDPRPDDIRAYVVDRDGIDGHDRILLTLDPFDDQRRAFQFGVSALGVQYDAVIAQQGASGQFQQPGVTPSDPSWDAIWSSAGAITEGGYVVEAAIPFRSLRFPSGVEEGAWGAYITRWWPRSSNVELRSAAWDRSDACLLCQSNVLSGLAGITRGANVQLTPTLTASKQSVLEGPAGARLTGQPTDGEVGLDASWGMTSDLTLNLTANPDFSQVEADVAQLDVNNRFALFFPEKRPFFLEGADFFGTPFNAVFTRSIADPVAGAKLTGKLGAQAVGVLVARDRATSLLIPGAQSSSSTVLEDDVTTAIGRFRRDIGTASTLGALFTAREGARYSNRVGGVDAFFRPVSSVTLQAQVLRTDTEYPDEVVAEYGQPADAFTGYGARLNADWSDRDWTVFVEGRRLGEGFRADAGFMTQAGLVGGSAQVNRRIWGGSGRWFTQLRANAGTWYTEDLDGTQLNGGLWMGFGYDGPGQTTVNVYPNFAMTEHFDGVTYDGLFQLWFDAATAPTGALQLSLMGNVGDVIDFANSRLGRQLSLSPSVDLRVGRNVETRLQHTYQRLRHDGAQVFSANLSQLRAVYNFSPRSFLRTIVQYRRTDRNPAEYLDAVDRRSTGLLAQVLYAYKLNPQTVFFLGYGEDGSGSVDVDRVRFPYATEARAFFLKLGYAWRP